MCGTKICFTGQIITLDCRFCCCLNKQEGHDALNCSSHRSPVSHEIFKNTSIISSGSNIFCIFEICNFTQNCSFDKALYIVYEYLSPLLII